MVDAAKRSQVSLVKSKDLAALTEEPKGPTTDNARIEKIVWTAGLQILAMVTALFVLYETREVVGWILIALVIAFALVPAVDFLRKRGWKRPWALATVLCAFVLSLGLILGALVPVVVDQGRSFLESGPQLLSQLRQSKAIGWADRQFHVVDAMQRHLSLHTGDATQALVSVMGGILSSFVGVVTVFVIAAFSLVYGGRVFRSLVTWVRPDKRENVVTLCYKIKHILGRYVVGTLIIASIGGTIMTITLAALRVPYFLPLGFAMVMLGLIPYAGAAIGGILITATAFASVGKTAGLIALAVFIAYLQIENHLLQPLIQRRSIEMNPLLIVVVMLLGTTLAGVVGAILSLPVAAAAQIVLQDLKEKRQATWSSAY